MTATDAKGDRIASDEPPVVRDKIGRVAHDDDHTHASRRGRCPSPAKVPSQGGHGA